MWIITTVGFFSIVQKPEDKKTDTLTIRARVRSDLEALRDNYLPTLGPIVAHAGTDYQYRATAPRAEVAAAIQQLVLTTDYPNFKNVVASRQGYERASIYGKLWTVLYGLADKIGSRA